MYVCMCCAAAALEPPLFHTEEEEGNINIAVQCCTGWSARGWAHGELRQRRHSHLDDILQLGIGHLIHIQGQTHFKLVTGGK